MYAKTVYFRPVMKKAVIYYRVSTQRQGRSGLGLEAQEPPVTAYLKHVPHEVIGTYTEVESTRRKVRPQLMAALQQCQKQKARLIIPKLDRLGRDVYFISGLMKSKVDFIALDVPEANPLVLHIMAAFAEHEREQISARTKAALQAAKRRGVKLGQHGKQVLSKENQKTAEKFAKQIKPVIQILNREGFTTLRSLASELNRRKVPTFRPGGRWHMQSVQRVLGRL